LATWTSREYGYFFAYQVIPALVKDLAHLEILPMLLRNPGGYTSIIDEQTLYHLPLIE